MKILAIIMVVLASAGLTLGDGITPVENLQLVGTANGAGNNFTNLNQLTVSNVNVTVLMADTLMTTNLVSSNTYDKAVIDAKLANTGNWDAAYSWVNTNGAATASYSNKMANKTLGSEGLRLVGALGGYDLKEFMDDTAVRGAARDMPQFTTIQAVSPNLSCSWTDGDVYYPPYGYYNINAGSNTLVDNTVNYAYWSKDAPNVVSWTTGSRPNITNDIVNLVTISTAFGRVLHKTIAIPAGDLLSYIDDAHYQVFPSIIVSGCDFYHIGTNLNQIGQNAGVEVHDMKQDNQHPAKNLTEYNPALGKMLILTYHTNSTTWNISITNQLDIGMYDTGSNLAPVVEGNWYRGLFYSASGSASMGWLYPVGSYTNYESALAADDPQMPSGYDPYIPKCTAYIFQGGDISLRTTSDYWIDRRFMIKRGTAAPGGSGGSSSMPTLFQVLTQGKASGGLLMDGLGDPANDDQVSSKHYVDSKINQNNAGKAFVSDLSGNDATAQLDSAIKPYKTIQAAINAAYLVASDENRYVVDIAPGEYHENILMKDDVGLRGPDIEAVKIYGTVTYPPAYVDQSGAEIALLTIRSSNAPALVLNPGDDKAYMGIRSCYLSTTYDNDATNKSLVVYSRGIGEDYGTSYHEMYIYPTNGSESVRTASIFEHVSDPANPGLSRFTVFNASAHIYSSDMNDDISLMYTHDNTDPRCINTALGTALDIDLMEVPGVYSNFVKVVNHSTGQGRTLSMTTVTRLFVDYTNNLNVAFGFAKGGPVDNVAIVRGNHIRMSIGSVSNIWLGAACGTNDRLRVYDSVYIQNFPDFPYPKIYTNEGTAGKFFINTVTENGDHLFGSAVDFSVVNSTAISTPVSGHLKQYVSPYAGLENMYFKDSSGNTMRNCRDIFYNGYNAGTDEMRVGDVVYQSAGLSSDNTPNVKKAIASDVSTLPIMGVVAQLGGISTGRVGRIMLIGRLEQGMDTSMWTSGTKLYLSETVEGGLTNAPPSGTNYSQQIATVHIVGTNGFLNVRPWAVDSLGNLPPSSWARFADVIAVSNTLVLVDSNLQVQVTSATNRIFNVESRTSNWNTAYSWVSGNSNGVASVFGRTNVWNAGLTNILTATTNLLLGTPVFTTGTLYIGTNDTSYLKTNALPGLTNGFVTAGITNGLATTGYVQNVVGGYISTNLQPLFSTTNQIIGLTNAMVSADSNLQVQVTSATNRILRIEANTSNWNNVANPVRFWANKGGGLQTINNTTAIVLLTNVVSQFGGTFSNSATVARWIPGLSNATIRIYGSFYWDLVNGTMATFVMRKNGSASSVLVHKRANNAADDLGQAFEYIDITTNADDYYEIWATTTGSEVQLGVARDNWWAGQVLHQ